MKFFIFVVSLLLVTGCTHVSDMPASSSSAGIDGKWAGTFEGGMGGQAMELSYDFKAAGDKLTGTTGNGQGGAIDIQNGKIDGNKISFDVPVEMGEMKMSIAYKGVLSGDELKFTFTTKMEGGQGGAPGGGPGGPAAPSSFIAKRVK